MKCAELDLQMAAYRRKMLVFAQAACLRTLPLNGCFPGSDKIYLYLLGLKTVVCYHR